jgi:hypothetical protein
LYIAAEIVFRKYTISIETWFEMQIANISFVSALT